MVYKDIINFTVIRKLKQLINDTCIIFNNIVTDSKIKKRESEYYEVYNKQYNEDIDDIAQLRDKCLHTADLCNKILMMANQYHIKQYYINKEILQEYEFSNDYINEITKFENSSKELNNQTHSQTTNQMDDDDIW